MLILGAPLPLFVLHYLYPRSVPYLSSIPSLFSPPFFAIPVVFISIRPFVYPRSPPTFAPIMSNGKTFKLSNGVSIPGVGFGTFSSEGNKGESYKATLHALRTGYRHLDCAWFYLNEDEVGQAIKDFLKENTSVKREDLFVCTKVWNHLHRPEDVEWSFNNSLKNLQLDYIDLFLVHWPIAAEKETQEKPKIGADGKVFFCFAFPAFYRPAQEN